MSESSLYPIESICENDREIDFEISEFFDRILTISSNRDNSSMPNTIPVLDIKNLSIIPNFDGNPNKLHRFINASESILTHYYDHQNQGSFQNILLLNGILNKLEGKAEEVVGIRGANSWIDIKSTLIQNFGDHRDENCLNLDLVNMRQRSNETPYQFHERIIHILNTICNYIDLHGNDANEKIFKRNFFTKQALKSYLAGLREPLGPIIRAMRPDSIAQALQFISEENNIKYYQHSNNNIQKNPNKPNSHPNHQSNFPKNHQQQYRHPNSQPSSSNQFPRGPIDIRPNPNPPQQKYLSNSQVFGKPKDVWKPNPNAPQPKPTPMSIAASSSNTRNSHFNHHSNYMNKNKQRPNTITEEVFNTEFDEQPLYNDDIQSDFDQEHDSYYDENHQDDSQNFQETLVTNDTT